MATERDFYELLKRRVESTVAGVVYDPDIRMIPEEFHGETVQETIENFGVAIFENLHDLMCVFKPNVAHYMKYGEQGVRALGNLITYSQEHAPEIPVLLNTNVSDIEYSAEGYVEAYFRAFCQADGVTVNPWMGSDSVQPFIEDVNKGIFVLGLTSNDSSLDIQRRKLESGRENWEEVVWLASHEWNKHGNVGVTVAANNKELKAGAVGIAREIIGEEMWMFVAGVGKQGAKVEEAILAGGAKTFFAAGRSIIYEAKLKKGESHLDASRRVLQGYVNEAGEIRASG